MLLLGTLLLSLLGGWELCRSQTVRAFDCPAVTDESARRVYFHDGSGDEAHILQLKKMLASAGAYHINLFPPSTIVCMLPERIDARTFAGGGIVAFEDDMPQAQRTENAAREIDFLRECYALAHRMATREPERSEPAVPVERRGAFGDTVLVIPQEEIDRLENERVPRNASSPETRRFYQNTEFMIGDIVINLILPECDFVYSVHEWTDELIAGALQGAIAGMLWFQEEYKNAPLNFIVRSFPAVRIPSEPINMFIEDHGEWITECIQRIDPACNPGDPEYVVVHRFNSSVREYYDADWAFTAFIAHSLGSRNQMFYNASWIAYALLGGPYLVIPFPTGPVYFHPDESYRMAAYLKHEVGHIFWALDEWQYAQGDCHNYSGYLDYINGYFIEDIVNGGPVNTCDNPWFACFMQYPEWTPDVMCRFTAGHMGLIDADENGVPDVFDSPPVIVFEGGAVETVTTDTVTVRGRARSIPIPNRNSKQDSTKWISYAATMKDAVMNIDGFGNLYLLPEDGRWDEIEEDLAVPLREIPPGRTSVEISVRTTAGYKSLPIVKEIYRAGLTFSLYEAVPHNDGIALSWYMVGETFDAIFDLYRMDLSAATPDTILLAAALEPAAEPEQQFVQYFYFDTAVEPLKSYGYFVRGTYELSIQGGIPQTFVTDSRVFNGSAILPIRADELISAVMPNPFNYSTGFSIRIPRSYEPIGPSARGASPGRNGTTAQYFPGLSREIPTPIDVAVYDVTGRKIAAVLHDSFFGATISISWDGRNGNGETLPSGIYFLKVIAGAMSQTRKMVILR